MASYHKDKIVLPRDSHSEVMDVFYPKDVITSNLSSTPADILTAVSYDRPITLSTTSNNVSIGISSTLGDVKWMRLLPNYYIQYLLPAHTTLFSKTSGNGELETIVLGGSEVKFQPVSPILSLLQVTGLVAEPTYNSVTLTWNPVVDATNYIIYSGYNNSDLTELDTVTSNSTTFTHLELDSNTTLYYQVKPQGVNGIEGTSSVIVPTQTLVAPLPTGGVDPADTTPPTMVVTVSSDPVVDTTATITFTASEPIVGFTLSDIYLDSYAIGSQAGTLDNFQGSGAVYTARYTAPTDTQTDIEVGVGVSQFTDLAGNTHEGIAFVKFGVESTPIEAKKVAFLLGGQSNMVGRADYDGGATYPSTVQQWKQSKVLAPAVSPLDHLDERGGDMGLALQFAIDYMEANPTHELVLIPAAKGGSAIQGDNNWGVGDAYYNNAIDQANTFFDENPEYALGGILWHQGESDAGNPDPYQELFDTQIHGFRSDITVASEKTPFICGELAPAWIGTNPESTRVITNNIIKTVSQRVAYTHCISSENLHTPVSAGTGTDYIHFDAPSLRLMGSRYYTALVEAKAKSAPVPPPTVVEQVTGLIATAGDEEVTLNWDAISNASKYVIYSGTNSDNMTALNNGETSNITFTHQGLSNGQERFYAVQAEASDGTTGDLSATVSAIPVAPPIIVEQVTGLTATVGDGEITLNWDTVSNASDYVILTGLNTSSMTALNDGVTPNTTYNHTGLTNGEERFYAVRAKASDGTLGDASDNVSATPIVPENIPAGYILRTNFDTGEPVDVTGSTNLSLHRSGVISDDPIRGKVFNSPVGNVGYIDTAKGGVIGSNSFTLSTWVNMPSFGGKFALFGSIDKVDARIVLFIGFDHLLLLVNQPYDRVGGVGRKEMPIEYLNTWIMVSATYNRDTGDVKLYINGEEFSSGVGNPGGDFTTGLDIYGFRSLTDHAFVGLADDGIIWDRELSPEEIMTLYNEQNI